MKFWKQFWRSLLGYCMAKRHGVLCQKGRGHVGRHKFKERKARGQQA